MYIAISLRFYQSLGLDLSQIGVLYAINGLTILVFDPPTGFIADRVSYRRMLLVGIAVQALVFAFLAFTYQQWPVYPLQFLWGLGVAIARGADGPLARKSADIVGANFARYSRLAIAASGIAEGVAGLGASALSWWQPETAPRIAMGIQAVIYTALLYIPWKMHEEMPVANKRALTVRALLSLVHERWRDMAHTIWDELKTNREGRWLVFYGAVIDCTTSTVVNPAQPMFETLNLQLWQYGVWWAAYHFLWAGFSLASGWYERVMGRWGALASLVAWSMAANALMAVVGNTAALVILVAFFFMRGIHMPIILDYMTGVVRQSRQATMLAVQSSVQFGLYGAMNIALGYAAKHFGVHAAFGVSFVVYGVLGMLFIYLLQRATR